MKIAHEKTSISLLHIGWGFYPWRGGGLILYARDLMQRQLKDGYKVSYFCAGRKYPITQKPRVKTWDMNGVKTYEIINSSISHRGDEGTLLPYITMTEPISEILFKNVLNEIKPDIVHIHELAGLPSSLIDILIDEYSIPCLMTLADYYLLCPTLKLFNHSTNKTCSAINVGENCIRCCLEAPKKSRNDIVMTIHIKLDEIEKTLGPIQLKFWRIIRKYTNSIFWMIKYLIKLVNKIFLYHSNTEYIVQHSLSNTYQMRRNKNIERLNKIPKLIARSRKVKEIYTQYLGVDKKIAVINPTLSHIDSINMKKIDKKIKILNFATLNGFVSKQKGGDLLTNAILKLNNEGYHSKYRVYAFGGVHPNYKDKLEGQPNIFYMGTYDVSELDRLLDNMHVGIIPSIWEEVFGYVGLELMAKGLPIIANNMGGITDYLMNNINGLLNIENSEDGFIDLIRKLIDNPKLIVFFNENIRNTWNRNYERHYQEIMESYYNILH